MNMYIPHTEVHSYICTFVQYLTILNYLHNLFFFVLIGACLTLFLSSEKESHSLYEDTVVHYCSVRMQNIKTNLYFNVVNAAKSSYLT